MKKYDRIRQATDHIIQRMRFACWISEATYRLRVFNNCLFSTANMVRQKRFGVFIYTLPVLLLFIYTLVPFYVILRLSLIFWNCFEIIDFNCILLFVFVVVCSFYSFEPNRSFNSQ